MAITFLDESAEQPPATPGLTFLPEEEKPAEDSWMGRFKASVTQSAPKPSMTFLPTVDYGKELELAKELSDFEESEDEHFQNLAGRYEDRGDTGRLKELNDAVAANVSAKRSKLGLTPERFQTLRGDLQILDFKRSPAGKLSTGEVVVRPDMAFRKNEWESAIDATDATPDAKARAKTRRAEIRSEVMPEVMRLLPSLDEWKLWEKVHASDPKFPSQEDLVEGFFERMDSRTGGKLMAQLGLGTQQGLLGLGKSMYSTLATGLQPGPIRDYLQETADTASTLESATTQAREALPGGPWFKRLGTLASAATSLAPAVIGGGLGGLGGSAVAAGAQSFGTMRQEAYENYRRAGMSDQDAERYALVPAYLSGLQTALTTTVFRGGIESAITNAASREAVRRTIKQAFLQMGKSTARGATDEAAEEFSQTMLDGIISQWSHNPKLSDDQIIAQAFEAGAYGGVLGGGMAGGKTAMDMQAESHAADLEASGLRQAADAVRDNPAAVSSAPETAAAPIPGLPAILDRSPESLRGQEYTDLVAAQRKAADEFLQTLSPGIYEAITPDGEVELKTVEVRRNRDGRNTVLVLGEGGASDFGGGSLMWNTARDAAGNVVWEPGLRLRLKGGNESQTTAETPPLSSPAPAPRMEGSVDAAAAKLGRSPAAATTGPSPVVASELAAQTESSPEQQLDIKMTRQGAEGEFVAGKAFVADASESTVYREGDTAIKIGEPYNDASPELYKSRVENRLNLDRELGDGTLRHIGFYEQNGVKNPVFAQPWEEGTPATQEQIDLHLARRGFVKQSDGTFRKRNLIAKDLDGDNVKVRADGSIAVIDGSLFVDPNAAPEAETPGNAAPASAPAPEIAVEAPAAPIAPIESPTPTAGSEASEALATRIKSALAAAPTRGSLDAQGKQPGSIDFPRPSGAGTITVQNTKEAIRTLAERSGIALDDPKYLPAVRAADGTLFTAPNHTEAELKAHGSGAAEGGRKPTRGFVDRDGKFLSLLDVARVEAEKRAAESAPAAAVETTPEAATDNGEKAVAAPAASSGGEGSPAPSSPAVEFVQSRRSQALGDRVVQVDVPSFDAAFAKDGGFYVAPGKEGVPGRRASMEAFLRTGKPVEMAEVSVSKDGVVSFTNGRHRFSVLRDNGQKTMPVSMDEESAANAQKHGLTVEAAPPSTPAPPAPPAAASESPNPASTNGPTSIKNAQVDIERRKRGLPPAMEPARRDFGQVWDEAMALVDADPNATDTLLQQLDEKPRPLSDLEDAQLLHRQIELQNQYHSTARRLAAAKDAGENGDVDRLREQAGFLADKLLRLYNIEKAVGTANSRGLNARKMLAREDFSLAAMITRKRAANGGKPLDDMQTAEVEALHAKITELQAALDKLESGQRDAESDAAADDAVKVLVDQVEAEGREAMKSDDEAEAEPDAPAADSPGESEEQITRGVVGVPVARVKGAEIASRPDLMQFKRVDDAATGVNKEDKLAGQWDDRKAGVLLLWEPSNPAKYGLEAGQKYIVANGHHRLEFGNRQGVEEFNSQIIREADGVSAEDARSLGAEINIADGKGTIYDQTKFLRDYARAHGADEAVEAGRRIGARGRKAAQIAFSATDRLFDAFTNGAIEPDPAAAIAAAVPGNEGAQLAGMRYAMLGKSAEQAANRARAETSRDASSARSGPVEVDLFGNEVFADIDAQAERATEEQRRLTEEIRAVRGAANKPELARKHGVDVADPEGVKKRITELEQERERWENWPSHPDLVAITKQPSGAPVPASAPAPAGEPAAEPAKEKGGKKAEKKKFLAKALEGLKSVADEAKRRIAERRKNFSANPFLDPANLYDHALVGADLIARGATTLGRFTARMVIEFGEYVRTHIGEIFTKSREIHAAAVSPRDLNAERESIVRGMRARAGEGDTMADLRGYVRKLALNFVRRGVVERDALVDAVHDELKGIDPNLTRREAMDLISGYGHFKTLDPEKAKAELRDLAGQLQQIGKLLDMESGVAPKASGVEQRERSDEERKLTKQVNEAKKRGGFEVTDAKTQLKSTLASIGTRIKNEIKDAAERIATGVKPKKRAKGYLTAEVSRLEDIENPTSEDAARLEEAREIARLEALRDRLKQTLSDLEEKPGRTDEQRLASAMEATRRSLAEYNRRLMESDFTARDASKDSPTSPELESLKAERNAVKQEYEELRGLDEAVIAQKAEARTQSLREQIAEIDRRFKEGDIDPAGRAVPILTPEQESLVSERDAMLRQLNELRREAKAKPAAEKQVEAVLKQIEELDRKLSAGDLDPKTRTKTPPLSEEAERLMSMRDAMRQELQDQREAAKPKRSKEEIALQTWKTRALRRIADIQRRLAAGDFTSTPRMPVRLDADGTRINFELEEAKKRYNVGLIEDRMRQRSIPMRILGSIGETLNLARAMMTSVDLSAVLRQGGFITLAHPIRTAHAFPDMFRAMMSEAGKYAVEQQIANRENAHLYGQTKLAVAQEDGSLRSMEEAYMSRWAKSLIGWKGAAIGAAAGFTVGPIGALIGGTLGYIGAVPASERAYTTMLKRLRADSFDALAATLGQSADITLDEAKAIARFVNAASGRPSLGAEMDKAATVLNHVFFAPKYVASRFMLLADPLTGFSLSGGTARNRLLVAKEYGRYLIGMAIVYAIAKAFGGKDPEWDPRSADFGKIRFGNTRLDPLSGIAQMTTFLSRQGSTLLSVIPGDPFGQKGRNTKLGTGEFASLHHGAKDAPSEEKIRYGGENTFDLATRFMRTKLSPAIGSYWDITSGQNVVGENVTPGQGIARLFVPLSYRDILNAMQEQGMPAGAALATLAILGAGVQVYDPNKNPDGTPKKKKPSRPPAKKPAPRKKVSAP